MATSGSCEGCESIDLSSCQATCRVRTGSSPTQPRPQHHPSVPALQLDLESVDALTGPSHCVDGADYSSGGFCCCGSGSGSTRDSSVLTLPPTLPTVPASSTATSANNKEEVKEEKEEAVDLDLDLYGKPSVGWEELDLSSHGCGFKEDSPENSDYPFRFCGPEERRLQFGLSRRWSTLDYSNLSFEDCEFWSPRQDSTPSFHPQFEAQNQNHIGSNRVLFRSVSANSALSCLDTSPSFPFKRTLLDDTSCVFKDTYSLIENFPSVSRDLKQRSVSLPSLIDEGFSRLNPIYDWATFISFSSQHRRQVDLSLTDPVDERDFVCGDRPQLKRFRPFGGLGESITEEDDNSNHENHAHSYPVQGDSEERNLYESLLSEANNRRLSNPDSTCSNCSHHEYMNNNPASYDLFGNLQSNTIDEVCLRSSSMKRSSSEGRTRARARFSSDVDSPGYSDKRLSDSEGSDTHSQLHRGRTSAEKKFRSNGTTRSKKTSSTPSSNSAAVSTRQRPTKLKQPKQPETQGTPAPQRKTQQRRILPSVGVTQQKAYSRDVNGITPIKSSSVRRSQYARSQTMPIFERKTDPTLKTDEKLSRLAQAKTTDPCEAAPGTDPEVDSDAVSKDTTQRRSILRVMRRPTEEADSQIYRMKPSDVRLNNGVWSEAKQDEEENEVNDKEVEEEMVVPSEYNKDSASPNNPCLRPKPTAQNDDEEKESEDVESAMTSMMSYSVDTQPDSVTTSAVIHLANNSLSGTGSEGDTVDNAINNDITHTNNISNGTSPTPHHDESFDNNNAQSQINGNNYNNNNDADQPDANSREHSLDMTVSPSTPSKSNSEPLLNTEENAGLDRRSTFRRPKETTKSKFSASENHLSDVPRTSRIPRSAPTTPAQGNAPVFPKSSTGSDGNSSGGGSNTSTSLPPGAPWSKETWTSRKRYEMAHSEHDHFLSPLSSLNQYARDLRLEKSQSALKTHAHDHAQCYHQTNGSQETEHFRTDHHCNRDHCKGDNCLPGPYLTPRQRLEKETRMLKREVSKLLRENEQKEAEVFALKCQVDGEKNIQESEKDEQIVQLTEKLGRNEKERYVDKEALCKAQEEIADLNDKYAELERQMVEQKAKYDEYLLGMYRKGQEAARFEREQELDYLLANAKNSKKAGVSLTELSRKLSRTEGELARWQALRLSESYNSPANNASSQMLKIRNNHHSLLDPTAASDADVTLAFVRDGFFHLLTDPVDREQHMRALLKIFAYPGPHLERIKTGLADFKNIKMKKVFVDAK